MRNKGNPIESKNAFVKREQDVMKSMMGGKPSIPAEMERFDAYMSNSGEKAESFGSKLTEGLDKRAFPVS